MDVLDVVSSGVSRLLLMPGKDDFRAKPTGGMIWRNFKFSRCPKDAAIAFSPLVSTTISDFPLTDFILRTSEMKKPEETRKREKGFKSQRHKQPDHKHSELYLRPDAVASSISKKLGVKKRQIVGEKK